MVFKILKLAILSCAIIGQCIATNHKQNNIAENRMSLADIFKQSWLKQATVAKNKEISIDIVEQYMNMELSKNEPNDIAENGITFTDIFKQYIIDDMPEYKRIYISEGDTGIVDLENNEIRYNMETILVNIPDASFLVMLAYCVGDALDKKYSGQEYANQYFKFYFNRDYVDHTNNHINTDGSEIDRIYQENWTDMGEKSQINVAAFCNAILRAQDTSPLIQVLQKVANALNAKKDKIDKNIYTQFAVVCIDALRTEIWENLPSPLKGKGGFEIMFHSPEIQDLYLRVPLYIDATQNPCKVTICSLYPITVGKVYKTLQYMITDNDDFLQRSIARLLIIVKLLECNKGIDQTQRDDIAIAFSLLLKDQLKEYRTDPNNEFFENYRVRNADSLPNLLSKWCAFCSKASDSSIFREAILNHVLNGGRQEFSIFSEDEIKCIDRIVGNDTLMPFAFITCMSKDKNLSINSVQRMLDDLGEKDLQNVLSFDNQLTNGWFYERLFPTLKVTEVMQDKDSLMELREAMKSRFAEILRGDYYSTEECVANDYIEINNVLQVVYPKRPFFDDENINRWIDYKEKAKKINEINIPHDFAAVFMSICAQIGFLNEEQKQQWISRIKGISRCNTVIGKQLKDLAINLLNATSTEEQYKEIEKTHNILSNDKSTKFVMDKRKMLSAQVEIVSTPQGLSNSSIQQENKSRKQTKSGGGKSQKQQKKNDEQSN